MNIFKKIYCRTYQFIFKILIPFMPYRQPKVLKDYDELIEIIKQNDIQRALIVTDKSIKNLGLTQKIEEKFEKNRIKVIIFDKTVPNPTTDNVEEAYELFKKNDCQMIVGFGGGSPIDCAKAVGVRVARPNKKLSQLKGVLKVRKKLPLLVAVPTTAGTGSETTLASVITDSVTRHKYAINDFPLIPNYAILDASLTLGLPPKVTATTGMDALTHAVEAFIGKSTTRQTRRCAKDAVKLIFENLEECYKNPNNFDARERMLKAAYLAGVAFTKSYVGYVHAIAHSLGGKYDIAHGLANAIILPKVLKKYGKTVYKKLWQLGFYAGMFDKSFSKKDGAMLFIQKIEEMNKNMNIESTIEMIKDEDISDLAKTAESEGNPLYPVPKLFDAKKLEEIYKELKN